MKAIRTILLIAVFWLCLCPLAQANPTSGFLQSGATAFAAGNYSRAIDHFTQAIGSEPELAYSNRCLTHLQMQRFQAAADDCTQALSFNPDSVEALLNLGLAHHNLGQYDRAIASYQQLLQHNPDDYRAYYNLGLTQVALGQYEQAIAYYTKALETSPERKDQASIYRDRGVSHLLLTNYAAAITDLGTAIGQNPNDLWAYFNRGCAYHRSQNFRPALQDFSWVIAQDQQNAQAYFNRGIIYAQMGNKESAILNLQQAAQYFQAGGTTQAAGRAWSLIEKLRDRQPANTPFPSFSKSAFTS